MVLNRTPAEAVVALETTVLLMKFTFRASSRETPAPSQPATLLAMMLLVTVGDHQLDRRCREGSTSVPLMSAGASRRRCRLPPRCP